MKETELVILKVQGEVFLPKEKFKNYLLKNGLAVEYMCFSDDIRDDLRNFLFVPLHRF